MWSRKEGKNEGGRERCHLRQWRQEDVERLGFFFARYARSEKRRRLTGKPGTEIDCTDPRPGNMAGVVLLYCHFVATNRPRGVRVTK